MPQIRKVNKLKHPLRVQTDRANPEQVRHYIRALRGILPAAGLQRLLTIKQVHEIATIDQARNTRQLIPCKIAYKKGFLKWFSPDQLVFIRRNPRARFEFSYHNIENIILNNQMSFTE